MRIVMIIFTKTLCTSRVNTTANNVKIQYDQVRMIIELLLYCLKLLIKKKIIVQPHLHFDGKTFIAFSLMMMMQHVEHLIRQMEWKSRIVNWPH